MTVFVRPERQYAWREKHDNLATVKDPPYIHDDL
jgi:hypothetical protein